MSASRFSCMAGGFCVSLLRGPGFSLPASADLGVVVIVGKRLRRRTSGP
jgi:hypothetical protein